MGQRAKCWPEPLSIPNLCVKRVLKALASMFRCVDSVEPFAAHNCAISKKMHVLAHIFEPICFS